MMSQNCEPMARSQMDLNVFSQIRELRRKVWGTSLLSDVVLVSSIKPISNGFKRIFANKGIA